MISRTLWIHLCFKLGNAAAKSSKIAAEVLGTSALASTSPSLTRAHW